MQYEFKTDSIMGGCIAALVGIIALAIGFFLLLDTLRFLPGTVSANGTIVSCKMVRDSSGSTSCEPTVSFATQAGQPLTFSSSFGSSSYSEGETVTVRYHPTNPQDARIDSWVTRITPLFIGGIGLLFFLVGLSMILRGIIRRAREGVV
jgi:Protein of unknown function (DUF3592)